MKYSVCGKIHNKQRDFTNQKFYDLITQDLHTTYRHTHMHSVLLHSHDKLGASLVAAGKTARSRGLIYT